MGGVIWGTLWSSILAFYLGWGGSGGTPWGGQVPSFSSSYFLDLQFLRFLLFPTSADLCGPVQTCAETPFKKLEVQKVGTRETGGPKSRKSRNWEPEFSGPPEPPPQHPHLGHPLELYISVLPRSGDSGGTPWGGSFGAPFGALY